MSCGTSCPCQFNCAMDTQGSKRDPISSEKEWLDFAVRYMSREAVCKGKRQETVWSSKCKPSWWDSTVHLPWKNPTANPKDTKEELMKKFDALNKHLREEGRFPKELEEEATLWAWGKYEELFLLTLLTSIRIKAVNIHTNVVEANSKGKKLKTEWKDTFIRDIQFCLGATLKEIGNLSENLEKRTLKRALYAEGKENVADSIKKFKLLSEANKESNFVSGEAPQIIKHSNELALIRKESVVTCIPSPVNLYGRIKYNSKEQEGHTDSPYTPPVSDQSAGETNKLQHTTHSNKITVVYNPPSAEFLQNCVIGQQNTSEKGQNVHTNALYTTLQPDYGAMETNTFQPYTHSNKTTVLHNPPSAQLLPNRVIGQRNTPEKGQEEHTNEPYTTLPPNHGAVETNKVQPITHFNESIVVHNPPSEEFISTCDVSGRSMSVERKRRSSAIGFYSSSCVEICPEKSHESSLSPKPEGHHLVTQPPCNFNNLDKDVLSELSPTIETSLLLEELQREITYERQGGFTQNSPVVEDHPPKYDFLKEILHPLSLQSCTSGAEFFSSRESLMQYMDDNMSGVGCNSMTLPDANLDSSVFNLSPCEDEPILDLDLHFSPEEQNKLFLEDDIEDFISDLADSLNATPNDCSIDLPMTGPMLIS